MAQKTNFRKIILVMHLWVGIPCALILFIMCLTGTMYVFSREITQWIDGDKFKIEAVTNTNPLPIAKLINMVEENQKSLKTISITIPQDKLLAWTFAMQQVEASKKEGIAKNDQPSGSKEKKEMSVKLPDKKQPQSGKIEAKEKPKAKNFLVNPYTGKVQGNAQTTTNQFFNTVLQLHRWLLISNHDIGAAITGTAAVLMIFLQISGFILWLPAKIKSWKKWNVWKQGFKIKYNSTAKRFNFDLHKTLGFYAFVFVTIMALTGPSIAFDWYKTGFNKAIGAKPIKKGAENDLLSAVVADSAKPISVEAVIAKTNELYNYEANTRIIFPKNDAGVFNVQKAKDGFFTSAFIDKVSLDQYNGNVVKLDRFSDKSLGDKIATSIKIIHTGELFGTFSKILYFMACLLATSLPVTGIIIWWGKQNKKKPAVAMV